MDGTVWESEIAKRDEIIRQQAEEIAALKQEVAELKALLKERAATKDAKRPTFSQDYSLSRQERQRSRRGRKKSTGRKPTESKQNRVDRTEDVYPPDGSPQGCELARDMKTGTSLILTAKGSDVSMSVMPRTARSTEAGTVYHVLNRGNGQMRIFHKEGDYLAFQRVLAEGLERYPVELFTYCLMPNHWHLVVRPGSDDALGRWLGWVGVTHVRRHREQYRSRGGGHLYRGRFKSFPVAEDEYFLTLCRYVEANALRAGLAERAEQWRWSGLWQRTRNATDLRLGTRPVERPRDWIARVNRGMKEEQLDGVRICVQRGRPLGSATWVQATAERLGLDFTLRSAGRPRKTNNQ